MMYSNKVFLETFILTSGISVGPDIVRAYNIRLDLAQLFRPLINMGYTEFVKSMVISLADKENPVASQLEIIGVYGLQDIFSKELYEQLEVNLRLRKELNIERVCREMVVDTGIKRMSNGIEFHSYDTYSRVIYNGRLVNNLGVSGLWVKLTLTSVFLKNGLGKWDKIGVSPYKRNKAFKNCYIEVVV